MQEVPFKGSNHILHSVNTHCWTVQDITKEKTKGEQIQTSDMSEAEHTFDYFTWYTAKVFKQ